ncbi:hypothetical protein TNIN_59211 [Trichonephila inaurata madagascariensis]|uniref:Uncharacterized protein n=1 Tax=Trichonephila inaurata madagascariensis TaxID=2747483 RepID=A0A8X6K404_9ARAC|nr:hypothetical protein TNIN_59211 [Trichonephila inaurata madagascariensis]
MSSFEALLMVTKRELPNSSLSQLILSSPKLSEMATVILNSRPSIDNNTLHPGNCNRPRLQRPLTTCALSFSSINLIFKSLKRWKNLINLLLEEPTRLSKSKSMEYQRWNFSSSINWIIICSFVCGGGTDFARV